MTDTTEQSNNNEALQVPLHFVGMKGLRTLYANQMMVQEDESDIILSFFETLPPVIPPETTARTQAIEQLQTNGLEAECVAKIRIGKHRFSGFVKVLSETETRLKKEMQLLGE